MAFTQGRAKIRGKAHQNLAEADRLEAGGSDPKNWKVEIAPIKTGRKVTHVELRWWRKDAAGVGASARELTFSKVGRQSRIDGAGEALRPRPAAMEKHGAPLQTDTYQTARLRHPGYDIYFVESAWRGWSADKEAAKDPDRAFLAFFAKYAVNNPI